MESFLWTSKVYILKLHYIVYSAMTISIHHWNVYDLSLGLFIITRWYGSNLVSLKALAEIQTWDPSHGQMSVFQLLVKLLAYSDK